MLSFAQHANGRSGQAYKHFSIPLPFSQSLEVTEWISKARQWAEHNIFRLKPDQRMETAIFTLLGAIIGGLISVGLQYQRFHQEIKLKREEHKTDFMAEHTVKHFLNHKSYTDRSFETIKKHVGGFEDDELRKILVRAGAIRTYRNDGSEWWRLLSRMDEFIEKKTNGQ